MVITVVCKTITKFASTQLFHSTELKPPGNKRFFISKEALLCGRLKRPFEEITDAGNR
jgi:hypothetical protein